MKVLATFLLFASCLAQGNSQRCYQCATLSTDVTGMDMPITIPGYQDCSAAGEGEIVDCSSAGGCEKAEFNLRYSSTEFGNFMVGLELRTCGANANQCLGNDEVRTILNQQRNSINSILATSYPTGGISFTDGDGTACVCNSDLCNDAPGMRASMNALLIALATTLFVKFAAY